MGFLETVAAAFGVPSEGNCFLLTAAEIPDLNCETNRCNTVRANVSDMIELYSLSGCPYCAKVEAKLEELDLEYERHEVPRRRSKRTTVQEISDQSGVPVLVDSEHDVSGMPESADIVAYLESTYG